MKVGDKAVHHLETVSRGDEKRRPPGAGADPSALVSSALQCPHRIGPAGDNPLPLLLCPIYRPGQFRGNAVKLGGEPVLLDELRPYGPEAGDAHVKGEKT